MRLAADANVVGFAAWAVSTTANIDWMVANSLRLLELPRRPILASMPEGVEHATIRVDWENDNQPILASMPEGVEHQ